MPCCRKAAGQPAQVAVDDGFDIGVGDHRAGALVFAKLGGNLAGERNGPPRPACGQALGNDLFVLRPGVGVQQTDGDRIVILGVQPVEHPVEGGDVERLLDAAIGKRALSHLVDIAPAHQRRGLGQVHVVGIVPLLAPDNDDVAKARGSDQRGGAAFALQDGIGRHRGGVQDAGDLRRGGLSACEQCLEARKHRCRRIRRGGRHLVETQHAGAHIFKDEVGEGPADIECDTQHWPGRFPFCACAFQAKANPTLPS